MPSFARALRKENEPLTKLSSDMIGFNEDSFFIRSLMTYLFKNVLNMKRAHKVMSCLKDMNPDELE